MDDDAERTKVEWREWGEAAFAEAEREGKPVLLALTATWSAPCREMDAGAYAEPGLAANVNDGFVPIRVDADRHPRVCERYNMGGFPSTVFCTSDGRVVSGATYLDVQALRQVVERVLEAWEERDDVGRVPRALRERGVAPGEVTDEIERLMAGQVDAQYDAEYGGWGTDAKFPLPRTLDFALKRDRERARTTLDAVERSLFNDFDGGFFRFAAARDWSDPRREKRLDVNAALLGTYATAYLYTGEERYREVAERTRDYLVSTLWTGSAFGNAQRPGDYFDRPAEERRDADEPAVDPAAYADGNAVAADALLRLVAYTDDESARRYAERTLDALDARTADGLVAHAEDEGDAGPVGLLCDQARTARALATAAQVLDPAYAEDACAVADATVETLREADTGAFLDGVPQGVGLLDRPLRPIDDNAVLADALVDLAVLTGETRYREVAHDAVAAFADAADRLGPQVAGYASAASRLVRSPLVVRVATDPGTDLHRAALRMADHEKVVVPGADGPGVDPGCAYVETSEGRSAPAETPAELADRVADELA